jgi:hypothetical protein
MNMEHWTECSEFDQDPGQKKHEKAGYAGIRRLIVSQTSRFNFTLHDCTSDFKRPQKERTVAAPDVQMSA